MEFRGGGGGGGGIQSVTSSLRFVNSPGSGSPQFPRPPILFPRKNSPIQSLLLPGQYVIILGL